MKAKDYEGILNALQTTGIYVIAEDTHEILYFNQRVKEIVPDIRTGMVCHGLWSGTCVNCPLPATEDRKVFGASGYREAFGKTVDITASRILWEDRIPAFVVSVIPHAETAAYSYHKILKGNLTLDTYEVVKIREEERDTVGGGIWRLSDFLKMFAAGGYVYEEDVERFLAFCDVSSLKRELLAGKRMLVCNYRRKDVSGYRWNTMEVIPDSGYTEENQLVMIYIKDVQDVYSEGLEHEELNLKNEVILRSLGEVNFGIYMIGMDTGYTRIIRRYDEDKEIVEGRDRHWDKVMEELVQRRYHPDYREKFRSIFSLEKLREAMEKGRDKIELMALREICGEYHYVTASGSFYKDGRNRWYVVLAFQDVDERIRSEIKRTQNDRRMAAVIESRYSVMNTLYLDTGVCERVCLSASDEEAQVRRGEYSHYIETAARDSVYEADRKLFLKMLSLEKLREKAAQVQKHEEMVFRYRLKGTPILWVEEHIFFIRQEGSMIVNILGRDITEEKKKEEEENLLDREKAYIINSLSSMFFATYYMDLTDGTFRGVVQREDVSRVLGKRIDGMSAFRTYAQQFIHPEDQEDYLNIMDYDKLRDILSPEHPVVAFEYRKKENESGKKQWIRATVVLAETQDGKPKTALYVAQDVTEVKQKEERERKTLIDAYNAANQANASKSEFLSRMSHDIRTPMNAIIGMTAIAGMHLDDRERVADCLGKITVSSKHLLSLINEVLDMSKIESGKIDLTEEEFNLSDLMDSLLTIIRPSVRAKNHELEVRVFDVKHENVVGDALRLQQVFTNILSNAVKYTPESGKIEIEIKEKQARVYGYGCYDFVFRDNGIGISREYQEKIFEPFSRAEDSRVSKIEGTGLGMTIAQNIVRMMNGTIRVDSQEGQGSQFTVTVFLKQQDMPELDISDLENLKVLVADDDECACEAACTVLNDIGMSSEWVLSGEEAIQRVKAAYQMEESFFAVILDWKMPGMDGIAAAKEIRKLVGPDVPIIILSAYDWSAVEEEAKKAGVDSFISKPLFKSRLVYLFKQFTGEERDTPDGTAVLTEKRDFSDKRILLVEDNELNREIAEEIIGMTGAAIESAVNGKEAVEMFEGNDVDYYDLIFMDIQMPVMNGYEATAAIRRINRSDARSIPIIAMTANAFAEDVQASRKAGMNEHISKPLDLENLMKCMDEWIK